MFSVQTTPQLFYKDCSLKNKWNLQTTKDQEKNTDENKDSEERLRFRLLVYFSFLV